MMKRHMTDTVVGTSESSTDLIAGTGWTWQAAASLAKRIAREKRIFGSPTHRNSRRENKPFDPERFEQETGWDYGVAVDHAAELRRDRRLGLEPRLYC